MEINMLLEIIVLIFIIIEIYSLVRHTKLEHRVEEHMELLDEHIKHLDEHVKQLDEHCVMLIGDLERADE
jgi:hypothetical protein